jgi:hypothetical protein
MAECKSCHAPITWVVSAATGKRMPLDVEPTPDGNISLDMAGMLPAAHVHAGEKLLAMRELGRDLYLSHFVTCPQAGEHRKEKGHGSDGSDDA